MTVKEATCVRKGRNRGEKGKKQGRVMEGENKGDRRKKGRLHKVNHKEESMSKKIIDMENSSLETIRMGEGRHKRRKTGRHIKEGNEKTQINNIINMRNVKRRRN